MRHGGSKPQKTGYACLRLTDQCAGELFLALASSCGYPMA